MTTVLTSGPVPALLLTAPVAVPLVIAALYAAAGWRRATAWAGLVTPVVLLATGTALAHAITPSAPVAAYAGLLRADALSVFMLLVIGTVGLLACAAGPGYLAHALATGQTSTRSARWYALLVQAFLAAMALAVLAGNLGVLWVAVEATTIVTAFLVGHRHTRGAVEAAWKYVVICSAGIALAFLGTVCVYAAARHAGIPAGAALDWATLVTHAHALDPAVMRIGIGLVVLGFGAKAGLVPLHAWLPDAHSQAPAPVSALMSGVLLAVAFTAVLRYKVIADAALGTAFLRTLLLVAALATLALAAVLLLAQHDYKRMLAYSSMEHMGLLALGAAIGSRLALAAVLLHILGHGLAKTVAFLGSGHILQATGSSAISEVRSLATRAPLLGAAFGLAILALLGLPPFSLFASELAIARAGFSAGLGVAVAAAFVLMLAAFAALAARTGAMLLGPVPDASDAPGAASGRLGLPAAIPLVAGLVAVAALGVTAWPLHSLLSAAAALVAP